MPSIIPKPSQRRMSYILRGNVWLLHARVAEHMTGGREGPDRMPRGDELPARRWPCSLTIHCGREAWCARSSGVPFEHGGRPRSRIPQQTFPAGLVVPWAGPRSQPPRAPAQEASLQLGRAKAAAGSQKVDPALTARIAEEAAAVAAAAAAAKRENDTVYLQRVPPPDSIARCSLPRSAVLVTVHWTM